MEMLNRHRLILQEIAQVTLVKGIAVAIILSFSWSSTAVAQQAESVTLGKDFLPGLQITAGYIRTDFLNDQYASLKSSGELIPNGGFLAGARYPIFYPILIDVNFFYAGFYWPDTYYGVVGDVRERNRGMETGLSVILTERVRLLTPYLGAYYQSSSLRATLDVEEETLVLSSVNTSQFMLKAGVGLNVLGGLGSVNFEYRHSIPRSIDTSNGFGFGYERDRMHHFTALLMIYLAPN
jgi:hypothetical protein